MGNWSGQLNVSHPFPADLEVGYLYPATITDDPLIPYGFEFTTVTFPFLRRPKDSLAEKAIFFGPESPVIDGFWLFHFSIRPSPNHPWGSQLNHNRIKILNVPHFIPLRN
jgi:hypothetical protein